LQLSDAMNDLQEQVKLEHATTEKNEHGIEVGTAQSLWKTHNARKLFGC
jgi:hypothetical protein